MFLVIGVAHQAQVRSDTRALEDAVARATAYIGDRAPAQFRTNLQSASTYEIQPGTIYRTCVRNRPGTRAYCVVVDRNRPFAASVRFAGSEPNTTFTRGIW